MKNEESEKSGAEGNNNDDKRTRKKRGPSARQAAPQRPACTAATMQPSTTLTHGNIPARLSQRKRRRLTCTFETEFCKFYNTHLEYTGMTTDFVFLRDLKLKFRRFCLAQGSCSELLLNPDLDTTIKTQLSIFGVQIIHLGHQQSEEYGMGLRYREGVEARTREYVTTGGMWNYCNEPRQEFEPIRIISPYYQHLQQQQQQQQHRRELEAKSEQDKACPSQRNLLSPPASLPSLPPGTPVKAPQHFLDALPPLPTSGPPDTQSAHSRFLNAPSLHCLPLPSTSNVYYQDPHRFPSAPPLPYSLPHPRYTRNNLPHPHFPITPAPTTYSNTHPFPGYPLPFTSLLPPQPSHSASNLHNLNPHYFYATPWDPTLSFPQPSHPVSHTTVPNTVCPTHVSLGIPPPLSPTPILHAPDTSPTHSHINPSLNPCPRNPDPPLPSPCFPRTSPPLSSLPTPASDILRTPPCSPVPPVPLHTTCSHPIRTSSSSSSSSSPAYTTLSKSSLEKLARCVEEATSV